MHVAIVGAGALGSVFGAKLAHAGGVDVSFVVRPEREADDRPIRAEHIDHDDALTIERPLRTAVVAAHADAAIVCVRYPELDDSLRASLAATGEIPLIVMTPMLPHDYAKNVAALGERVIVAMTGVLAYEAPSGAVRYYAPRSTSTAVDEKRPMPAAAAEVVAALVRAGVRAEIAFGVHEKAPATVVAFAPLAWGIDVAGSVDALLDDGALLDLTVDAAHEARELARSIGEIAASSSLLLKFVSKLTLRMTVAVARQRATEALAYVEDRFGRRAHAQNIALARGILDLARGRGLATPSMDALARRLELRDGVVA